MGIVGNLALSAAKIVIRSVSNSIAILRAAAGKVLGQHMSGELSRAIKEAVRSVKGAAQRLRPG